MLDSNQFRPDVTFWSKSWCDYSPSECKNSEEHIVSFPVQIFPQDFSFEKTDECTKILFRGDSFTVAPWVQFSESYWAIFSHMHAQSYQKCVKSFLLATGGANNGQELLVFSQFVDKLKPNIVIWQFFWNEEIENSKEKVYTVEDGVLNPKKAWKNTLFLAGFLNQTVPYLRESTLGKHLMNLGAKEDLFSFWPFDFSDYSKTVAYNQKIVPLFLQRMDELSKDHGFEWYSTLAPLECQFVPDFDNCEGKVFLQNDLRELLKKNSIHVSMESIEASSSDNIEDFMVVKEASQSILFNTSEDKTEPGSRHQSTEGNIFFGKILFQNFGMKKR